MLALALAPATMSAQAVELRVRLDPLAGDAVSGQLALTADGDGTIAALTMSGIAPGKAYRLQLHAGTCDLPSASATTPLEFEATADGSGSVTGPVLFRGADPVALATLADGEHVAIVSQDSVVACGRVGRLDPSPGSAGNAGLSSTRDSGDSALAAGFAALTILLLVGGRFSTARRTGSSRSP